jgi:hypothetical protein
MAWELETKIMIAALIATGLALSMISLFGDFNNKYDPVTSYDNSTLATALIDTQEIVYSGTGDLKEATDGFASGNLLDIVGGLLQGAIGILKLLGGSITAVVGLVTVGLSFLGLGENLGIWVGVATAAGIIVFVISIILRRIRG